MIIEEFQRECKKCTIKGRIFREMQDAPRDASTNEIICFTDSGERKRLGYSINDMARFADSFVVVSQIVVEDDARGKGLGSKALQELLQEFRGIPFLLEAGYLDGTEYERDKKSREAFDGFINNLVHFYEKNGFLNVNGTIGQYEEKVALVNPNGDEKSIKDIMWSELRFLFKEDRIDKFNERVDCYDRLLEGRPAHQIRKQLRELQTCATYGLTQTERRSVDPTLEQPDACLFTVHGALNEEGEVLNIPPIKFNDHSAEEDKLERKFGINYLGVGEPASDMVGACFVGRSPALHVPHFPVIAGDTMAPDVTLDKSVHPLDVPKMMDFFCDPDLDYHEELQKTLERTKGISHTAGNHPVSNGFGMVNRKPAWGVERAVTSRYGSKSVIAKVEQGQVPDLDHKTETPEDLCGKLVPKKLRKKTKMLSAESRGFGLGEEQLVKMAFGKLEPSSRDDSENNKK